MQKQYDVAVFVGRFQPLHLGHMKVIREGLDKADKLIILVGSAGCARSLRNPFTYPERSDMILDALSHDDQQRVTIEPLSDSTYNNDLWVRNVQEAVYHGYVDAFGPWGPLAKTALIGHAKDHTSFYLKLFPQWDSINVIQSPDALFASTNIREEYFGKGFLNADTLASMTPSTKTFLTSFQNTKHYDMLKREWAFICEYKKQWSDSPYPPTFVTVDAVVIQSGHILLVKRKSEPGKGMWAIPGGFLNNKEKIEDAVFRELKEETKIKVPLAVLKGSVKKREVFDDPERSQRGRTITHAFLIDLEDSAELPKVKGTDDAIEAKWVPLSEIRMDKMFEDHYFIINALIGGANG